MKSDDERSWAANRGYDDSAGYYYSYDSNVARHRLLRPGDVVVVREDDFVAGWALIQEIEEYPDRSKVITRCPECNRTNFYARSTVAPRNRCNSCGREFEDHEATRSEEPITEYRCFYADSWVEAVRPVLGRDLGRFLATADTYNAIRPLRPETLTELLSLVMAEELAVPNTSSERLPAEILGGHVPAIGRRRRGQRAFRLNLIDRFGEKCAFTGAQPPQVLEAAHLYSFATQPEHRQDGGLLLRRDVHALFDASLISVNPKSWRIEVAPRIRAFGTYDALHGSPLLLPESDRPDQQLVSTHYETAWQVFRNN
jgi:hypothetical protein